MSYDKAKFLRMKLCGLGKIIFRKGITVSEYFVLPKNVSHTLSLSGFVMLTAKPEKNIIKSKN
jgi:hypothetical protein